MLSKAIKSGKSVIATHLNHAIDERVFAVLPPEGCPRSIVGPPHVIEFVEPPTRVKRCEGRRSVCIKWQRMAGLGNNPVQGFRT
jgi:hypothetical protein